MTDRRLIANTVQTPNMVIDEYMRHLSGNEFKCYMAVVRKTVGWHKDRDSISIGQFLDLTGISKGDTVRACLKKLVAHGLVERVDFDGKPSLFRLPMEASSVFDTPPVQGEGTPPDERDPSRSTGVPDKGEDTPPDQGEGTPPVQREAQNPLTKPTNKTQAADGRPEVDSGSGGKQGTSADRPPADLPIPMTPDWEPLPIPQFDSLGWTDEQLAIELEAYRSSLLGKPGSSHDRRTPAQWSYNFFSSCLRTKTRRESESNANSRGRGGERRNQFEEFDPADGSWADEWADEVAAAVRGRS